MTEENKDKEKQEETTPETPEPLPEKEETPEEVKPEEETAEEKPAEAARETTPEKETAAEPAPEEAKTKETAPPSKTPAAAESAVKEPGEEKGAKIRLLSTEEVDKKLARARAHMGGDSSVYVKHLLARKAELESQRE